MSEDLLAVSLGRPPLAPVRPHRWSPRRRLLAAAAVVVVALGWIAARGLTGSFVYYLTPTEVAAGHQAHVDQRVRLGGYVVRGSVRRLDGALAFAVTDHTTAMRVVDTGSVPELFRPGQGVVLEGALGPDGRFHADTVLVKHDGTYRAPARRAGG
jgi:cytochrome c-type biogenesis protein CcmE